MSAAVVSSPAASVDMVASTVIGSHSFMEFSDVIAEGDTVIVYVNYGSTYPVVARRGQTLTMRYGALRHEFIIGKRWGSRVTATAGYVYLLRPSSELWTRALPRRTQILYTPDVSLILSMLDVAPGKIVCESGTGSGSLSHALAMAVFPSGHIYTHDIEPTRTTKVTQEFAEHGLSDVTTAVVRNVCVDGFHVNGEADAVFLDVPAPWEAVEFAAGALSRSRGGRFVSFSPCIEQVQRTCEAMRTSGFCQVETVEIVPRSMKVVDLRRQSLASFNENGEQGAVDGARSGRDLASKRKRKGDDEEDAIGEGCVATAAAAITFPHTQPTHTGYLTSCTMLPRAD